jgi:hypothetical protein
MSGFWLSGLYVFFALLIYPHSVFIHHVFVLYDVPNSASDFTLKDLKIEVKSHLDLLFWCSDFKYLMESVVKLCLDSSCVGWSIKSPLRSGAEMMNACLEVSH